MSVFDCDWREDEQKSEEDETEETTNAVNELKNNLQANIYTACRAVAEKATIELLFESGHLSEFLREPSKPAMRSWECVRDKNNWEKVQ